MPFINSRVSVTMTKAQKTSIKEKLGKAISIIPGKSEQWLMIEFADDCDLYFQGENTQPCAFIEVKVFGGIPEYCLENLTAVISEIYETDLQLAKDHIYIKYEPISEWGWTGQNF